MDISKMTNGIFLSRRDSSGVVEKISITDEEIILAKGGVDYSFKKNDGIGFTLLCNGDCEVLGYGSLRLEQIELLVKSIEDNTYTTEGNMFERLRAHDIYIVSSRILPENYFYMFLENRIPEELFESSVMDQDVLDMIENALRDDAHEDSHIGCGDERCSTCSGITPEEIRQEMDHKIYTLGHVIVSVEPDEEHGGYVYSVGMSDMDWPEFILTGINGAQGGEMLNVVIKTLRKKEVKPYDGMIIDNVMNVSLVLKEIGIDEMSDYGYLAVDRYAKSGKNLEGFTGYQVIWPDREGVYPFENRYNDENLPKQFLV